jgi:hypothetical protein
MSNLYHADMAHSDVEYRLLRQNIFERLASGSSVPQEAPLVPIVSNPPSGKPPLALTYRD